MSPFTYPYPRPMVTVDIFLLRYHLQRMEVLLIQRKNPPFQGRWALPGGYVEMEESLLQAARRELAEETGLKEVLLRQMDVFGDPGRDPRGRTITVVFGGGLPVASDKEGINAPAGAEQVRGGDDAGAARWFPLTQLPALAFDHGHIIEQEWERFRFACLMQGWWAFFLPRRFSPALLRQLFTAFQCPADSLSHWLQAFARLPFVNAGPEAWELRKTPREILLLPEQFWLDFWCQNLSQ